MLWVTRSNSAVSILISNIYFVIQGWEFGPTYPGSLACSLCAAFPTKRRGRNGVALLCTSDCPAHGTAACGAFFSSNRLLSQIGGKHQSSRFDIGKRWVGIATHPAAPRRIPLRRRSGSGQYLLAILGDIELGILNLVPQFEPGVARLCVSGPKSTGSLRLYLARGHPRTCGARVRRSSTRLPERD